MSRNLVSQTWKKGGVALVGLKGVVGAWNEPLFPRTLRPRTSTICRQNVKMGIREKGRLELPRSGVANFDHGHIDLKVRGQKPAEKPFACW